MRTCDGLVDFVVSKSGTAGLVPWYLMASLSYYHLDFSILSDGRYDAMCKTLAAEWGKFKHRHACFLDRDCLAAGTGFALSLERYPLSTRAALRQLLTVEFRAGPELTQPLRSNVFVCPEALKDVYVYGFDPYGKPKTYREWFPEPEVRIRVRTRVQPGAASV